MTGFYDRLAVTSLRLLTSKGRDVTLRRTTYAEYDPAIGAAAETTSDVTLKGALFNFSVGTTTVRGTLVQATDKQLLLEARSGVVPTVADSVVIGSDTYTIVSVGEDNPAGTPVLYELHLRK